MIDYVIPVLVLCHVPYFQTGVVNEPKDALAVKGLLQAHLPALNQVHLSRRFLPSVAL